MKLFKSKYFTPIALLIFFMPFLRMCEVRKAEVQEAVIIDTLNVDTLKSFSKPDKTQTNSESENQSIIDEGDVSFKKKDINLNAYQLGFGLFKSIFKENLTFKDITELEWDNFKDKDLLPIICYTFIISLSVLMIVFSWRKKYLFVRNLAIVNSILLLYSTILFINTNFIDEFGDVKYGFYVFFIYSILIAYIANKEFLELKVST